MKKIISIIKSKMLVMQKYGLIKHIQIVRKNGERNGKMAWYMINVIVKEYLKKLQRRKKKKKKEVKEKLEKAAGVAAAKKGAEWQKAMIKEPEKKDEGGGGEAAPAAGMKITDKQPSDTDVIE